jgi:enoyl-CoA hydratase/carnithine racemase
METGSFCGYDLSLTDEGVAIITFNRPERYNAASLGVKRDLMETLEQAQMDDRVRVIVFTGTGPAFIAGDDMGGGNLTRWKGERPTQVPPVLLDHSKRAPIQSYAWLRMFSAELNRVVRSIDKITIAAINGYAVQVGLSLALSCDFRVAAADAKLGSATLRMSLMPDEGGHWLLVQYLGVARAKDFMLRNRIVDAATALDLGLVNEVVEPDTLLDRTLELANEFCERPQVAMRLLKRAIDNAADQTFEQAIDDIATKTAVRDGHPDVREGIAAWREKRPAKFNAWLETDDIVSS